MHIRSKKKRLIELKHKVAGVYPNKTKIISHVSTESIQALTSRVRWRGQEVVYQQDPRHVDVLIVEIGLEGVNTVQPQQQTTQGLKTRNHWIPSQAIVTDHKLPDQKFLTHDDAIQFHCE